MRQGRQKFVLAAVRLAQDVLDVLALRHVDADADAAAHLAVAVVERFDVVLHVHDATVRADDLDDIGDVRAMRHRVLHRQLVGRYVLARRVGCDRAGFSPGGGVSEMFAVEGTSEQPRQGTVG